jgi:peptide/nickel transport system permease protein
MMRYLLPNCMTPLIVQLTFTLAVAIRTEAMLSFLGVGVPPLVPSWGNLVSAGKDVLRAAPWVSLFPGLAIFTLVLGVNLLGDGLRDVLDPKMQEER